jgi:hypothetical protein
MKPANPRASLRSAVYTRVSTEHGLEQEFNSLDNQREASEAFELIRDSSRIIESIAAREKKTERSIRMTLSLAFLSPALVKAAIDGRLSRGFGVKRLMDLPMSWSDQWSVLGLKAPRRLDRNLIGSTHHPQHTSLIPRLATRSGLRRSLPRKAHQPGFGKRNFAARDSPPRPAARGGQTRQMAIADRARPC